MASLKVDFDVELLPAPEAKEPNDTPAAPEPPPRAGATVFIARAEDNDEDNKPARYVLRSESGALLGRVPPNARLPPHPPPPDGAPAEVRSVRRRPAAAGADDPVVTTLLSVRAVLGNGGQSWPSASAEAQARAAMAAAAAASHAAAAQADVADGGDEAAAAYRARPEELARLAQSGEVREALRDPRLQRLLREIDGAPDRERALRAALGLPVAGARGAAAAAAAAAAVAVPSSAAAPAGPLGVDGGAFQSFAQLVLQIMDGGDGDGGRGGAG
jgi:hypothetical protein